MKLIKGKWELMLSTSFSDNNSQSVISLVEEAYKVTSLGSFIKTTKDVKSSNWEVLDWDQDPDPDVAIFYRSSRRGELWVGKKIQGIGHDGQRGSKDKVIERLVSLLKLPGNWIEASDAMARVLYSKGVNVVKSPTVVSLLFPDWNVNMTESGEYIRKIRATSYKETCFGRPVINPAQVSSYLRSVIK